MNEDPVDAPKPVDEASLDTVAGGSATDLQSIMTQNQMQNENRAYTAVSNIMKTKSDAVKNSIANIR